MLPALLFGLGKAALDKVFEKVEDKLPNEVKPLLKQARDGLAKDTAAVEAIGKALVETTAKNDLAQIELNKMQAQSASFFIAGARPAIMWICALTLLNDWVIRGWLEAFTGVIIPPLPPEVLWITAALLGSLGAYRSYDKKHKTDTKGILGGLFGRLAQ